MSILTYLVIIIFIKHFRASASVDFNVVER